MYAVGPDSPDRGKSAVSQTTPWVGLLASDSDSVLGKGEVEEGEGVAEFECGFNVWSAIDRVYEFIVQS